MSTCSSCHALHVACVRLHDRFILAMYILVAKCHVAVMLFSLVMKCHLVELIAIVVFISMMHACVFRNHHHVYFDVVLTTCHV